MFNLQASHRVMETKVHKVQPRIADSIAHLENVLSSDDAFLYFSADYWIDRILEIYSAAGVTNQQRQHLRNLLKKVRIAADR